MLKRLSTIFFLCPILVLAACATEPIDPKTDPQHFEILSWSPRKIPLANGHAEEWRGDLELNSVLQREFPVGTPRQAVEKYLLASGDLKPSIDRPEFRGAKYSVMYHKDQRGFLWYSSVGIWAFYDEKNLVTKPPEYFYHFTGP